MLKEDNKEIYIDEIEEIVDGLGYKLIAYKVLKQKNSVKIFIDIHKPNNFISHKDCNFVIINCKPFFEDKFGDNVELEVSSPGVNRLLKSDRELNAFIGYEMEIYFKPDAFNNSDLQNGCIYLLNDFKDNSLYLKKVLKTDDKSSKTKKHHKKNDDNNEQYDSEKIINRNDVTKIKLLN